MGAEALLYSRLAGTDSPYLGRLGGDALALPSTSHSVGGFDSEEGEALEQDAGGEIT